MCVYIYLKINLYLGGIKNGGSSSPISWGDLFSLAFLALTILLLSLAAALYFLFLTYGLGKSNLRDPATIAAWLIPNVIYLKTGKS